MASATETVQPHPSSQRKYSSSDHTQAGLSQSKEILRNGRHWLAGPFPKLRPSSVRAEFGREMSAFTMELRELTIFSAPSVPFVGKNLLHCWRVAGSATDMGGEPPPLHGCLDGGSRLKTGSSSSSYSYSNRFFSHEGTKPRRLTERRQDKASSIQYQTSSIQHPVSNIQHPVSNIQHPVSNIQYQTSSIKPPLPSSRPLASAASGW
jgi:hypothetical protein